MDTGGIKLIHVGRKCAVLGVDPDDLMGPWHVLNPGSWRVPMADDFGKTIGTSLCHRYVITNGYAADFVPASVCPACRERI